MPDEKLKEEPLLRIRKAECDDPDCECKEGGDWKEGTLEELITYVHDVTLVRDENLAMVIEEIVTQQGSINAELAKRVADLELQLNGRFSRSGSEGPTLN